ncbi:MAG: hypothetical protein V3R98_08455, partial [Alphaproteobacteria bacterium]
LAVKWGSGPRLKIETLTNANGEFRTGTPNVIYLDKPIAQRFQTDHKLAKAILLVESTVLHELVHWGDWKTDKKAEGFLSSDEWGKKFEKEAYGKDIQRYF